MATQALLALKAASQSKACEEQQASDRQRDTTVLVHHFLCKHGFVETASKLQQEGGLFLSRFESADNISLARIVQEYEDYHCIKFGNRPILTRTVGFGEGEHRIKSHRSRSATAARRRISQKFSSQQEQSNAGKFSQESGVLATIEGKLGIPTHALGKRSGVMKGGSCDDNSQSDDSGLVIEGGPCRSAMNKLLDEAKDDLDGSVCHKKEHRFLKPNPSFGGDTELRNLAASLSSDIIQESPGVTWEDVIDLDGPKLLLKEALIMPQRYPQLFTGIRSQWRGILLHGVPGTGKTLLAKAVASQSNTTFFSISASSIVSKYRGDSEKLVRVLFELARHHAPSTIFLDEIDAILGHRSSGGGPEGGVAGGEHEGSRRMKTELLIQMDGIVQGGNEHVFVLAASNVPWDLDAALLRRLEKRVLVPLPNEHARRALFAHFLQGCGIEDGFDFAACAAATEGYSGADIRLMCKEAAMRPVRRILERIHAIEDSTACGIEDGHRNASGCAGGGVASDDITKLMSQHPIVWGDFQASLKSTNPSAGTTLSQKHVLWSEEFGSM